MSYTTRVQNRLFFFFLAVTATGGRVRSFVRGGEALLRTRGMIGSSSVYGKVPTRQLCSSLIAVSRSGHTEKQINSFHAVIHTHEIPPRKRFSVGCSSPLIRLAEHLPALRAWCQWCLRGQSKPDVLRPGTVGMRGSMVRRLRPSMVMSTPLC